MDPSRLSNTYQSFDPPTADGSEEDLARRLDVLFDLRHKDYFLFFGAIEPKKNLGNLIEAFIRSEVKTRLVIVGSSGWNADRELRLIRGGMGTMLPAAKHIRQIDYLPRRLLMDLVRGARSVLFPSLYEGFGLPALEALAVGTPLLTSNSSSLGEVAGDAAVYVDPYRVDDMAAAIRTLDSDAMLRDRLSSAGKVQAEKFAMSAYSARIREVYGKVLARRD